MWNQGRFPRTAVGLSVGVLNEVPSDSSVSDELPDASPLPYGDLEQHVGRQWRMFGRSKLSGNEPVASMSLSHAINPSNRVSLNITSMRDISASFNYRIRPNVSLQTGVSTTLPSWNMCDAAMAGSIGKPQLGIALSIGAV